MERKTDEEFLEDMVSQVDDLIGKMMLISDTYSLFVCIFFCPDIYTTIGASS